GEVGVTCWRRSKNRSAVASGVATNEESTPACSPTKSRSLPGARASSSGCKNFRFGNARTTLNGAGGSGEPTTREVVQGTRADFAGSAATDKRVATIPASRNKNADTTWKSRVLP